MASAVEAIYLFDPLCGWCYGAAPMIEALATRAGTRLDMVPAGLFEGEGAFHITPAFARHVMDADRRIAAVSGQVFSEAYLRNVLGDIGGAVDSGPATLALTAVRLQDPSQEIGVLKQLQHARYVGGLNISKPDIVAGILAAAGFSEVVERLAAPDPDLLTANAQRLEAGRDLMRRFEIRGVPALLAGRGQSFTAIPSSILFGPLPDLLAAL